MNGYIAFVEGQRHEIEAEDLYQASVKARALYKGRKKRPTINVALAEVDGKPVTHTAVD
jgi:hypothetical protein